MSDDPFYPEEWDDFIGETRGGYSVSRDGSHYATFERFTRAVAALYLRREESGYYPNVWYVNERGNTTLCVFDGHVLRFTDTAYV